MALTQVPNAMLSSDLQGVTPGFKNRIINGACVIDQRNAGASVTNIAGSVYTLDRWQAAAGQASKFTIQQNAGSVTPPVGFSYYLGCTSSSAYTVLTGEVFIMRTKIEGYNIADLNWGSANAKTVTLSFWVRSSLTGTFGGALANSDSTRTYPFSYTISSANTWTQVSLTITGDTSGTWQTTTGIGIELRISLGAASDQSGTAGSWSSSNYYSATGAVSVVGTNGATFYITGVQLEKGSVATSFDYRSIGQELALCQRYYQNHGYMFQCGQAYGTGTDGYTSNYSFPVNMRAAPTSIVVGGTDGGSLAQLVVSNINTYKCTFEVRNTTGGGTGKWYQWYQSFNAEL